MLGGNGLASFVTPQEFTGQGQITDGSAGGLIIQQNRQTMTGGFGHSHIARYYRMEYLVRKMAQQLGGKAVIYPHRPTDAIRTVEQWTAQDEENYLTNTEA